MFRNSSIIFLLVLFSCLQLNAQQKSAIPDEQLESMHIKFKEIQADAAAQKKFDKALEGSVDEMMHSLNAWLKKKKEAQHSADIHYQPGYNHKPGEMNLFPIWEEIPGPVPSLPEAKQTDFIARYQTYINKVTVLKKQLSDMVHQHLDNNRSNKQQMIEDQNALSNKNGIVQQMGGANAIKNMSDKERKQAAKNAGENMKTNSGATTGLKNAGMNEMARKMMSDPSYREFYNKMTAAQKEAELKKFMGTTMDERNDKAFEASINNRNNTYSAANVELLLGECLQQMQEAAKPYAEGTELANNFFNSIYKSIDDWYKRTYEKLPETNAREKIGHHILIRCKETILYAYHKKEAVTRTILWNLLKNNTKISFGKLNDYIGNYPWGKTKNAGLVDGNYTEPKLALAVNSIYDEMIRMTGEAERVTWLFKEQQQQYELALQ